MLNRSAGPGMGRTGPKCAAPSRCCVESLEGRVLLASAALWADPDLSPSVANLVAGATVDGVLYAGRVGPLHGELWRTDGSAAGTVRLASMAAAAAPTQITPFGTGVAFVDGASLYVTDGGPGDARLVHAANPDLLDADGNVAHVYASTVGGRLWFSCGDGLFASDGTAAGTVLARTRPSGVPAVATPDGTAYFLSESPDHAADRNAYLMRSDGTAAGTRSVDNADAAPDLLGSTVLYRKTAHYSDGSRSAQLWTYDGTTASQLKIVPTGFHRSPTYAPGTGAVLGGTYLFVASDPLVDGSPASQLWRTDGTQAGTVQLDIPALDTMVSLSDLTTVGGEVCFLTTRILPTLSGGVLPTDFELWATDGTAGGTAELASFGLRSATSAIVQAPAGTAAFVALGNLPMTDGLAEVWRTDGTAGGTVRAAIATSPGDDFSHLVPDALGDAWFNTVNAVQNTSTEALWHASGTVLDGGAPSTASATVSAIPGASSVDFAVTYASAAGFTGAALSLPGTVTVSEPDGSTSSAAVLSTDAAGADPTHRTVTYRWAVPGGRLTATANGRYEIATVAGIVDVTGAAVPAAPLGGFAVNVPTAGTSLATTVTVTGPAAVIGGRPAVARVTIRNAGAAEATGTVPVQLLLSSTPTAEPDTTLVLATATAPLRLRPRQRRTVAARFSYPAAATDGMWYVVAAVDLDGSVPQIDGTAATAAAARPVQYRHAFVDLSVTAAALLGSSRPGQRQGVGLRLTNVGDVAAKGVVEFRMALTGPNTSEMMLYDQAVPVKIPAARSRAGVLVYYLDDLIRAGTYTLTVTITPADSLADTGVADKTVTLSFPVI